MRINIQSVTPFYMEPPAIIDKYELCFSVLTGKQHYFQSIYIRNPLHVVAFSNFFNEHKATLSLVDMIPSYIGDLPESCEIATLLSDIADDVGVMDVKISDMTIQRYYDKFGRELRVNVDKEVDLKQRFVFYRHVPNGDDSCGLDVCTVHAEYLLANEGVTKEDSRFAYCELSTSSLLYSGWVDSLPDHIGHTIEVKIDKQTLSVSCEEFADAFTLTSVRNQN